MPSQDSHRPADQSADRLAAEVLRFARERLGPASEQLFTDPAIQVLAIERLRRGYDLEDAVLAEAHRAASTDRQVADEFVGYFLRDLMNMGHRVRYASLRRFLDTGDLVQSVLGDLWKDLESVRFETRGRFLAYLGNRLSWKATDRARALDAGNRQEGRRLDVTPEELQLSGEGGSPLQAAANEEERERLALQLLRVPGRDRELLTLYLQDVPLGEMAAKLGISKDAARMALQRAIRRARRSR